MKILITGGNGFIGRALKRNLTAKGHEPFIMDRRTPSDLLGDIKDRESVLEAVNLTDAWVNLAGLLGTAELIETPEAAVDVNIHGALHVFEAARVHKKPGVQIAVGNYWMNNPYSITKSVAERFALMYNKDRGTDVRVVRAMNVYGEGQRHRPVRKIFPNVVIPALLNEQITIYGSGRQIMDLIYVEDVCEILSRALLTPNIPNNIIYEAGVGGDQTINDLVEKVVRLTGSSSRIHRVSMRPGEETDAVVQISEQGWQDLQEHLNFHPSDLTDADDAFQRTIEWYRTNLSRFSWTG